MIRETIDQRLLWPNYNQVYFFFFNEGRHSLFVGGVERDIGPDGLGTPVSRSNEQGRRCGAVMQGPGDGVLPSPAADNQNPLESAIKWIGVRLVMAEINILVANIIVRVVQDGGHFFIRQGQDYLDR